MSPAFLAWLTVRLEPSLRAWFGAFEVVRDAKALPDPSRRYVIGYHPVGPAGNENAAVKGLRNGCCWE